MRKLLIILLLPFAATAQNEIALNVQVYQAREVFKTEKVFEIQRVYDRATRAKVKQFTNFKAKVPKGDFIKMNVPIGAYELPLVLYKVKSKTRVINQPAANLQQYRGIVEGDYNSLVSLTFADNEVTGFISTEAATYTVAKIEQSQVVYNDADVIGQQQWVCGTIVEQKDLPTMEQMRAEMNTAAVTAKCVKWYYEVDYDIFLTKGSGTAAYIQSAFNQKATLYANDGIDIELKTLYVWTTPDPYVGTTTRNYLDQFGQYRTSFDGDLAMLVGFYGGGGVAWINTLCSISSRARMAYCAISTSFSTVPTFSWTVMVLAHEGGHNLGSSHTHDCAWNGNNTRIDSCGDSRGYTSCNTLTPPINLPVGGGTIMSYCHLTGVGINFLKGFGEQPALRMKNNINNASCLSTCSGEPCIVPAQPVIQGNTQVAYKSTQVYSVTPVPTATSYSWTIPQSGWSGSSTTNSITTIAGSIGGTITVKANNNCGSSQTASIAVTIIQCPVPAQPGAIVPDLPGPVCAGDRMTYAIPDVEGMIYNWSVGTGARIINGVGTNLIMVDFDTTFKTSLISVTANNSCGTSAARTLQVVKCGSLCVKPKIITCSIVKRTNDVFVNRSGFTNYNYKWWLNSKLQGAYQTKIVNGKSVEVFVPFAGWGYQTVQSKLYKIGDVLEVEVGSTNGQTARECYITGHCEITIK